MADHEYEAREWREFDSRMRDADKGTLSERKQACAEFVEAMATDPALVGERIGWLLDGNYGYGAMQAAKRVVAGGPRMNKAAQLVQMIGALEWMCPPRAAAQGWKKLTASQKTALDKAVKAEIVAAQKAE